jgi:hypothetical protein
MHPCDGYSQAMNLVALREALRLLRNQSDLGVRDIPGVNASTVHRIENTRKNKAYEPEISSVEAIARACGKSLVQFLTTVEDVSETLGPGPTRDVLEALRDARTVKQVQGFLLLPEQARAAVALSQVRTSGTARRQAGGPKPGPKRARRAKSPKARRRSSGHDTSET